MYVCAYFPSIYTNFGARVKRLQATIKVLCLFVPTIHGITQNFLCPFVTYSALLTSICVPGAQTYLSTRTTSAKCSPLSMPYIRVYALSLCIIHQVHPSSWVHVIQIISKSVGQEHYRNVSTTSENKSSLQLIYIVFFMAGSMIGARGICRIWCGGRHERCGYIYREVIIPSRCYRCCCHFNCYCDCLYWYERNFFQECKEWSLVKYALESPLARLPMLCLVN